MSYIQNVEFLGAFVTLRRENMGSFMSVCLSVRIKQLRLALKEFARNLQNV